jgi:hypothetical protein
MDFINWCGDYFRKHKLVVDKGNLPECNAGLFYTNLKLAGYEVITSEQLILLLQNHATWKMCYNKKQRQSRENAEKFLAEVGIL